MTEREEKEFTDRYGVAPIRFHESDASSYVDFSSVDHSFERNFKHVGSPR